MIDLTLIRTSEDFELFCEDLLKAVGFIIESRPGRGPGQGKDIICLRYLDDEFDGRQVQRFLVECKHFASSGKSVYENDTSGSLSRLMVQFRIISVFFTGYHDVMCIHQHL